MKLQIEVCAGGGGRKEGNCQILFTTVHYVKVEYKYACRRALLAKFMHMFDINVRLLHLCNTSPLDLPCCCVLKQPMIKY